MVDGCWMGYIYWNTTDLFNDQPWPRWTGGQMLLARSSKAWLKTARQVERNRTKHVHSISTYRVRVLHGCIVFCFHFHFFQSFNILRNKFIYILSIVSPPFLIFSSSFLEGFKTMSYVGDFRISTDRNIQPNNEFLTYSLLSLS